MSVANTTAVSSLKMFYILNVFIDFLSLQVYKVLLQFSAKVYTVAKVMFMFIYNTADQTQTKNVHSVTYYE